MIGNELYNIPFHLDLNKFKMDVNPGTNDPASYESFVNISDPNLSQKQTAHIFMNNPLKKDKLTFYQASYFALDDGETFGSVLSVNYDPGRIIKYIGSILLVFGSILHFTIRSINKKSKRLKPIQASG